jgi:hypothetical protein
MRRLIELRARTPELQGGFQRSLDAAPDVYCFERDGLLVALNFTSRAVPLGLSEPPGERATLLLSTDPARAAGQFELSDLVLAGDEGVILRIDA